MPLTVGGAFLAQRDRHPDFAKIVVSVPGTSHYSHNLVPIILNYYKINPATNTDRGAAESQSHQLLYCSIKDASSLT